MKGSSKSGGRRATGASAARRREAEVPPGQFQQVAEPASGSAAAAAGLFRRCGGRELIICCASMSSARAYGRAVQTHAMGLYCWEPDGQACQRPWLAQGHIRSSMHGIKPSPPLLPRNGAPKSTFHFNEASRSSSSGCMKLLT